jgi:4-amino-4-deoxy-L-arabinose transferase-like glycosyltransferase
LRIEPRRSLLSPQKEIAWVLLALAVAWFAVCFRLGDLPLLQPDEGRNAEIAREMKESGAWLAPIYNAVTYLDKPAFYFKAVALSLAAFGDSETAARIPSAMFGLGLLALMYAFCRREHGARCAALAVIMVASMPLFIVNSRSVIFDMALAFFTTAAIFAGYRAEESEGSARRAWYVAGAAASGFATLVKGPVGFLIPVLVLLVFNRVEGRKGVLKRFFSPLNLLVFFGVVLPWFIGLSLANPDFPYYGIVEESFHRFTTGQFRRAKPFYFYAVIVMGMFFPWSMMIPEASFATWKLGWAKKPVDRLCIVWSVLVVIFFSLSRSKMPGYILSTTVACGILVARFFDQALADRNGKPARIVWRAAVAIMTLCIAAVIVAAFLTTRTPLLAHPLGLPDDAAAEPLKHQIITPIIGFLVLMPLGLLAIYRRDVRLCLACFILVPLLTFHTSHPILEVVYEAKSARKIAQLIPELPPQTEVACLECLPIGLQFYLRRTTTVITKDGGELTSNYILFHLKSEKKWPSNLVPSEDFDRWLAERKHPVYLLAREKNRPKLEAIAADRKATIQQLTPLYLGVLLPSR